MQNINNPFLSTAQMRALDAEAAQFGGGYVYMQKAGKALYDKVCGLLDQNCWESNYCLRTARRRFAEDRWCTRSVLILAGRGNNGGDGVVLALHLHAASKPFQLILLHSPQDFRGEAALAWSQFQSQGGTAKVLASGSDLTPYTPANTGLVVDALTGTGLREGLRGLAAEAVVWLNASRLPVLAVDVPSGANSGDSAAVYVHADWTLLFGYARLESVLAETGDAYGQWDVADLEYPLSLLQKHQDANPLCVVNKVQVAAMLPRRNAWGDKRTQGLLSVVAGSRGMTGAATLCAMAAMRTGAGMVHLACPDTEIPILAAKLTEVVLHAQASVQGALAATAVPEILSMLSHGHACCLGPGLSSHTDVQTLVRELVRNSPSPLVLDADSFNAFSGYAELLRGLAHTPIFTPHDKEWMRLFGDKPGKGIARIESVRKRAQECEAVILLKGAPTLIADPSGAVFVLAGANSGLAKAGSGDVLAGVISSLRAQGLSALAAALVGAWVHARAGQLGAIELGERGLLPSDLLTYIPLALRELECEV